MQIPTDIIICGVIGAILNYINVGEELFSIFLMVSVAIGYYYGW